MSVEKFTRNFESDTLDTVPASTDHFHLSGSVDILVKAGGPTGFTKVAKFDVTPSSLISTVLTFTQNDPYSNDYCNAIFLFRVAAGMILIGNQVNSSGVSGYCARIISGTEYNIQAGEWQGMSFIQFYEDYGSVVVAADKWYWGRWRQSGRALSVRVWEAGTAEPAGWHSSNDDDANYPHYASDAEPSIMGFASVHTTFEVAYIAASFHSTVVPDFPIATPDPIDRSCISRIILEEAYSGSSPLLPLDKYFLKGFSLRESVSHRLLKPEPIGRACFNATSKRFLYNASTKRFTYTAGTGREE